MRYNVRDIKPNRILFDKKQLERGQSEQYRLLFAHAMEHWDFTPEHFGRLLPFVIDENITDIVWNGRALWIDDLISGRYVSDVVLEDKFVEDFCARVANYSNQTFNSYQPLLEAQIDMLRISVVHESQAHTGTTIAIRRTSSVCRLTRENCLEEGFCDQETWDLLPKIILSGFSCISGGLPGVGKTELLKLLSTFIPKEERAIVMEDSPEFHYSLLNPDKDCTEWLINKTFTYETALKASLRQRPDWNILAEARGRETRYLMENFSSGIKVLTSTHLGDEADLIDRLENMIGDTELAKRIRNEIFLRGLVVFVLHRHIDDTGIKRRLAQVCFYSNEEDGHTRTLIVRDGKLVNKNLPPKVLEKFAAAGFHDPFAN